MYVLSITRLRVRSIWFMPRFGWYAFNSERQARKAKGIISVKVFPDKNRTFWTCSIWQDEKCMLDYMRSGNHKKAMPFLQICADEARTGNVQVSSTEFPSYDELIEMLVKFGKPSKLKYPNERHLKGIL